MAADSRESIRVGRGCALLDSALDVDGLGRRFFAAAAPFAILTGTAASLTIEWPKEGRTEVREGEGTALLRHWLDEHSPQAELERGGLVGYFAYEWGSAAEAAQSEGAPWFELCAYETFEPCPAFDLPEEARPWNGAAAAAGLTQSFSEAGYCAAVDRIREYIAAGDVYQVNLTQRFEAPLAGDPFALYRRLRQRNPAPFAAYIDTGATQIVSASPERLLRVQGRRAETRPIKGTRPRGRTPADDAALAQELVASPKDRAELLMIADLARNDLGQVCEFGSVVMERLWHLETHPTVHHLSAQVSGTLRADVHVLDALRAVFPGGSITGAPKRRAMEIIREIEPCPRHAYTGAIGYLGFDGDCDFSMAIRSFFCRQGRVRFHAGGGIVWDSDPAQERAELQTKAAALIAALTAP